MTLEARMGAMTLSSRTTWTRSQLRKRTNRNSMRYSITISGYWAILLQTRLKTIKICLIGWKTRGKMRRRRSLRYIIQVRCNHLLDLLELWWLISKWRWSIRSSRSWMRSDLHCLGNCTSSSGSRGAGLMKSMRLRCRKRLWGWSEGIRGLADLCLVWML